MNSVPFIIIVIAILIVILVYNRDKYTHKYKGLCLFDIDGTLTSGTHNEEVVQLCLNKGFAVGISTAGAIYTPKNVITYPWMPKNLYAFMQQNDFNTFNNVGSGILCGKRFDFDFVDKLAGNSLDRFEILGYRKGYTLQKTAELYNITNPRLMVMFDDMRSFLKGLHAFNNNFTLVCSGLDCMGELTVDNVKTVLNNL